MSRSCTAIVSKHNAGVKALIGIKESVIFKTHDFAVLLVANYGSFVRI